MDRDVCRTGPGFAGYVNHIIGLKVKSYIENWGLAYGWIYHREGLLQRATRPCQNELQKEYCVKTIVIALD